MYYFCANKLRYDDCKAVEKKVVGTLNGSGKINIVTTRIYRLGQYIT